MCLALCRVPVVQKMLETWALCFPSSQYSVCECVCMHTCVGSLTLKQVVITMADKSSVRRSTGPICSYGGGPKGVWEGQDRLSRRSEWRWLWARQVRLEGGWSKCILCLYWCRHSGPKGRKESKWVSMESQIESDWMTGWLGRRSHTTRALSCQAENVWLYPVIASGDPWRHLSRD